MSTLTESFVAGAQSVDSDMGNTRIVLRCKRRQTKSSLDETKKSGQKATCLNATSVTPSAIYAVAVKGYIRKSDSGARTVDLRMKSGGTDSAGTNAGQAPATTYGWLDSFFETDPNTSAAWLPANLNAATSGYKVAS